MGEKLQQLKETRLGRLGSVGVFLLIVIVFSFFMRGESTGSFNIDDESFTIELESGYSVVMRWDAVISMEERDTLDAGVLLDGTDTETERSGTWENDEFGVYSLCTYAKVDRYLVLHTQDGVFVVNLESSDMTSSLGDAIEEMRAPQE